MQLSVALPRVNGVEVRRQQAQQESEGLRTGRSLLESFRHLSENFIDQGRHVGGRVLVKGYGTHERFMEWEVPTGYLRGGS